MGGRAVDLRINLIVVPQLALISPTGRDGGGAGGLGLSGASGGFLPRCLVFASGSGGLLVGGFALGACGIGSAGFLSMAGLVRGLGGLRLAFTLGLLLPY